MWTRIYLGLLLVRLYFALRPSYIHPDENFQGPEVFAGHIFNYTSHLTWEFTSERPVRSVFPLWPAYGLPMVVLHGLWSGTRSGPLPPRVVYYTLRVVMFVLSFVLEDWAVWELVESPRRRRLAVVMVASSYVTWTYQTHTFSNAVETLVVLWSLVLIQRIKENKGQLHQHSSEFASALLGMLVVFGTFNRITFPAFIFLPGISLVPQFFRKPLSLFSFVFSASITLFAALATDTQFYHSSAASAASASEKALTWLTVIRSPTFTPINSLLYNINETNLAEHGLHPYYQHLLVNLPLLMAPVLPLLVLRPPKLNSLAFMAAAPALVALSSMPHQEARFLLPLVPLILSSVRLPPITSTNRSSRIFLAVWALFNIIMGVLMGTFHQAGVVPMQIALGELDLGTPSKFAFPPRRATASMPALPDREVSVLWWKSYSPPVWLAHREDGQQPPATSLPATADPPVSPGKHRNQLRTIDLMGKPVDEVWTRLEAELEASCDRSLLSSAAKMIKKGAGGGADAKKKRATVVFVAPVARGEVGKWAEEQRAHTQWEVVHEESRHVGLDDLDFEEDGIIGTLGKVVWGRGLRAWKVTRPC